MSELEDKTGSGRTRVPALTRAAFTGDLSGYYAALRGDPCAYCGEPAGTRDHVVPWPEGPTDPSNLASACAGCNRVKRGMSLLGFLGWRQWQAMVRPVVAEFEAERVAWRAL